MAIQCGLLFAAPQDSARRVEIVAMAMALGSLLHGDADGVLALSIDHGE